MNSRVLKISAEELSQSLYLLDPMHTCCFENSCFDEYSSVAECIVQRIGEGDSIQEALSKEFMSWFGMDLPESAVTVLIRLYQD